MRWKDKLKRLARATRHQRDAIRLQLHLAHQNPRDEWEDLEQDWERFRHKLRQILHNAAQAMDKTLRVTHKGGRNLRQVYENWHRRLL